MRLLTHLQPLNNADRHDKALHFHRSVLMLETVNYIEHYGLQRQKKADGR